MMSRMSSILTLDITLQRRYGFYYAGIFVTLVWIVLLKLLPASWYGMAVPFVIFVDLGVIGLYFLAGQFIFEKMEGTLNALVVSPLRFREYLLSKLITLTLLSWIISMIVAVVTVGLSFNILIFSLGVITTSVLVLSVGMFAVIPYSSISSFIMPSQLYLIPITLPIIDFIGWIQSPLVYLIPTHASLLLLKGAFSSIGPWDLVYSLVYPPLWIVLFFIVSEKRFHKYVIAGGSSSVRPEGGKKKDE